MVPPVALLATMGNGPAHRFIHGIGTPASSEPEPLFDCFFDFG